MKKWISTLVSVISGFGTGTIISSSIYNKIIEKKSEKIDKFKSYYNILNQWLILKQKGQSLEQYFINNHYNTIALYGMGELGSRLYDELEGTSIKVKYAIDKNVLGTYKNINIQEIASHFDSVDVIVVCSIFAYDDIKKILQSKTNYSIISLEDIIYEI